MFFRCAITLLLLHSLAKAQTDSLLNELKKTMPDSSRVKLLNRISLSMIDYNPDSSFIFSSQALALAKEINFQRGIAAAYSSLGICYQKKGDHSNSAANHFKALGMFEEIERSGKGTRNRILRSISKEMNSLGIAYENMKDNKKALEWYSKGLEIDLKINDLDAVAGKYNNMAAIYVNTGDITRGKECFLKALKINEQTGNLRWKAINLGNLGNVAEMEGKYDEALRYYEAGLEINKKDKNKGMEAIWLGNIGSTFDKMGNSKKAEEYYLLSEKMSQELGDLIGIELMNKSLYQLYKKSGRFQKALEFFERSVVAKDSIFNTEKNDQMTRSEVTHEFQIKQAEMKAEQDKKDALAQAEKHRQQLVLSFVIGVLGIVLISGIFILRSLRITRKQKLLIEAKNKETESQKQIIEDQHKDILDSIRYAKRIQQSLLPTEKYIEKQIKKRNDK